jgi:hypothetical protein
VADALISVTEKGQNEPAAEGRLVEVRVEELARHLAQQINSYPTERREQLREMAVHLVRDEVQIIQPQVGVDGGAAVFNPLGLAIPLGLAGAVMLILFPPVGLVLFAVAFLMALWGVAAVWLVRR